MDLKSLLLYLSLSAKFPSISQTFPAIHALTARNIIQDLEDGRHDTLIRAINEAKFAEDSGRLQRTVKAYIVRLGKTYYVVSSHTSFVAVDESGELVSQPVPLEKEEEKETYGRVRSGMGGGRSAGAMPIMLGSASSVSTEYHAPQIITSTGASAPPPPQPVSFGARPPRLFLLHPLPALLRLCSLPQQSLHVPLSYHAGPDRSHQRLEISLRGSPGCKPLTEHSRVTF